MIEIIPTVVPRTFTDVVHTSKRWAGIAPVIHIDAADGEFAKNHTWLPTDEKLPALDTISYEVHLMTKEPRAIGERFIRAGAWRIIGHLEALGSMGEAEQTLGAWRAMGAREVGVALLITTPIDEVDLLLKHADVVHLMTISSIGSQGLPFADRSIGRVRLFKEKYPSTIISVDGGINDDVIAELVRAGATRFSVGSALSKSSNPVAEYKSLFTTASEAQERYQS